ncbi:GNAT family N-acetyltransferase [Hirschia baltica]|uniref:GCN5-related N-acetyltransferase n=1 Tax=Hirschia baltica (strain ATCC 49814 / DSM 5838 / IFAM 1418) TaxID=582402 RepID=C6XRL6_HIRBI|nr:GNAT family N-acetyltransferase [Hirschia baltica]ACT60626.1 GCN5-related N-acetyltransferase [Hirschia baltica ATCC 49814]
MKTPQIVELTSTDIDQYIDKLCTILHANVHDGASVNFIVPFSFDDAKNYWKNKIQSSIEKQERTLWAAFEGDNLAGSVQLDYSMPPNQNHRCEVSKLIVHPDFRRRGIARKLMAQIEDKARELKRQLITLDTVKGSKAEPLYLSLGFEIAGILPGFSRHPIENRFDATTYMYKNLAAKFDG